MSDKNPAGSAMPSLRPPPVIAVRGVAKAFGGAQALDGVSLTVEQHEVHGLVGENGSGKSTLIKILSGYHSPDAGDFEFNGRPIGLPLAAGEARKLGLSFVHQDLGLIGEVSVLENLKIGDLAGRRRIFISWRNEFRAARQTFERFGVDLDPRASVDRLGKTERALLAIVRAAEEVRSNREMSREEQNEPGLLVLDEPTVFLPKRDVERLFALVREVVKYGVSVLFVSHDLDEAMEITDRITALRDGRIQGTVTTAETSKRQIVSMMIGRSLEGSIRPRLRSQAGSAAELRHVGTPALHDVSLTIRRGELVGITGILGSGFEQLPYAIAGAAGVAAGVLEMQGRTYDLRLMTPARALKAGIALVPGDRQRSNIVASLPVSDNMMLPVLDRYRTFRGLQTQKLTRRATALIDEFDIRPRAPLIDCGLLSGGNQQKAGLAKWLQLVPALLLLDEPTQGVDVGAREQIFGMMRRASDSGTSMLCASTDYEQLSIVCDRVLIFSGGAIINELTGSRLSHHSIASAVYDSGSDAHPSSGAPSGKVEA